MTWASAIKAAPTIDLPTFVATTYPAEVVDWDRLVTLDFETYYDADYTLNKLSTSEYIRDKRFKAQMVGIKIGRKPTKVYPAARIAGALRAIPWATHSLLCHNAQFDAFILSHHYGIQPKKLYCTLSMARGLHSNEIGAGLDEVSKFYGRGGKIEGGLEPTKGVLNWSKDLIRTAGEYCANDVDECFGVFEQMLPQMPRDEIDLIDLTVRMFTDPVLKVDIKRVEVELAREIKHRKDLMLSILTLIPDDPKLLVGKEKLLEGEERDLARVRKTVGSNERFAALLKKQGVTPPRKISPAWMKKPASERKDEDKYAFAFAKDDQAFIQLPDNPDEWSIDLNLNRKADVFELAVRETFIRGLVETRLAVKSTTNITRAQRFLTAGADGLPLPCGYSYFRAHCLTGDAQVLTRQGWTRLDQWCGGEIAQWSSDAKMIFENASPNEFEVDEDIVVATSRYHTAQYTLGHTLPAFTTYGTFKPRKAGKAFKSRFELPLSGVLDGDNQITILEAQIAAMVQADGSIRTSISEGRCVRFGFKKQRKIDRCRALLNAAGIPSTEHADIEGSTRIVIGAHHMRRLLVLLNEDTKEFLPSLLSAPLVAKVAFIDELTHWDGSVEPHRKGFTYNTTNAVNAEMVQTLAHMTGQSAFVSRQDRGAEGWADSYRVYVRSNKTTRSMPKHYELRRHIGKVYCPTTKTGFFLIKQGGNIVVTGNTGRWGGNNKMNMQNLTRDGELRQSILAPKGHQIVVADSGQIEARVNGWLWGQDDLLAAFADADRGVGRDAYCLMADVIYGRPITKADATERFVGKVCLGENTRVFTNHGLKRIIEVRSNDLLWDGESWVTHEGLVDQGVQETLTHRGLCATPDHEILTERGWLEWQEVLTDHSLFQSALGSATLPLCDGTIIRPPKESLGAIGLSAAVRAGQSPWFTPAVSSLAERLAAMLAPKLQPAPSATGFTKALWRTTNTVPGYSTGFLQRSAVAVIRTTRRISTMVREASRLPKLGSSTVRLSWLMSKPSLVGMFLSLKWTELTRIWAMPPETFALSRDLRTHEIGGEWKTWNEEFEISRQTTQTYDLANAGPKQRFTVFTEDGPLIVHNCVLGLGFQMGAPKLQMTMAKGALGGPPVYFTLDECHAIVNKYRRKNHRIEWGWKRCKQIIEDMADGRAGSHKCLSWGAGFIQLPNGMTLKYPELKKAMNVDKGYEEWTYQSGLIRKKIYGGLLCENIVQALARIIVGVQMLAISKKHRVVMTTHDEVVACVKKALASSAFTFMIRQMRTPPAWCADIPLNAEGGFASNYSK